MNVKCIKDNCDMVPHDDNVFICLTCESMVKVITKPTIEVCAHGRPTGSTVCMKCLNDL